MLSLSLVTYDIGMLHKALSVGLVYEFISIICMNYSSILITSAIFLIHP